MKNPELKKEKKAKDSISALVNQCDDLREAVKTLADDVRSLTDISTEDVLEYGYGLHPTLYKCSCDGSRSKITQEDISSLVHFIMLSDRLCEVLEVYSNVVGGSE